MLLLTVLLLTPPNEAVVHPGTGSSRWFLRVAVMGMWDGAAASNDEEEGAQDEDLKRTPLPATGIGRIENGAADVTHVSQDAGGVAGTQPHPRASRARARRERADGPASADDAVGDITRGGGTVARDGSHPDH